LGEVSVVADVDTDFPRCSIEYGIPEVPGTEVKFLPEPWTDVRDVMFAILPEIRAVGVDHRGGVVIDAGDFLFVNRHDEYHPVLPRHLSHRLNRRAVRDAFHHVVPAGLLFGAEVGTVEEFLQAEELDAAPRRFFDERLMLAEHPLLDVVGGTFEGDVCLDLCQSASHDLAHGTLLSEPVSPKLAPRAQVEPATVFSAPDVCQGTYNPRFPRMHPEVAWLPTCR